MQSGLALLPLLKKPAEVVGKDINVPGSHWGESCPGTDKDKLFVCGVEDFLISHRMFPGAVPGMAFKMHELGEDGTAGNSDSFYMSYPFPALDFYYATYPNELPATPQDKPPAVDAAIDPDDGDADEARELEARSLAYEYLLPLSSERVLAGKQCGRMRNKFKCKIEGCRTKLTLYGKSTGSFFRHVRRAAIGFGTVSTAHSVALERLNASSCRQVKREAYNPVFGRPLIPALILLFLVRGGGGIRSLPCPITRSPCTRAVVSWLVVLVRQHGMLMFLLMVPDHAFRLNPCICIRAGYLHIGCVPRWVRS